MHVEDAIGERSNELDRVYALNYRGHLLRTMGRGREAIAAFEEGNRIAADARLPMRHAFNLLALAALYRQFALGQATQGHDVQLRVIADSADEISEFVETNNMPALMEYGDASDPDMFEHIRRYSPYQAVRDGGEYPAVMLTSGDLDTRVPPLQARRMTARLQAATGSGLPVILSYDPMGGHAAGRGRPLSLRVEDTAKELTFLAQQLGAGEGVPQLPGEDDADFVVAAGDG